MSGAFASVRLCVSLMVCVASAARAEESNIVSSLIPFDALSVSNRMLVRSVTDHYTLRREYQPRRFRARTNDFAYLMDNMDVCSVLAQKVGLIRYRATKDGQGRLFADDRDGAAGYMVRAFGGDGKRVYYVEGTQRGLFEVHGRGAVVLDYTRHEPDVVEYTGALFVKVDNVVVAALTQLFSMFLRRTVDEQFEHVLRQPIVLSTRALSKPQQLLDQISEMPESDRKLLTTFAEQLREAAGRSTN